MELIEAWQLISTEFPEFFSSEEWKSGVEFWETSDISTPQKVTIFREYIGNMLIRGEVARAKIAFDLVEKMLSIGSQDVLDIFCTMFLEDILNVVPDKIPAKVFVPLLGKRSKEYCRAWDNFCGVKTEGLHQG